MNSLVSHQHSTNNKNGAIIPCVKSQPPTTTTEHQIMKTEKKNNKTNRCTRRRSIFIIAV